jgi:hypothetical protein
MHMFSKVPPLEPGETEIVTADFGPAPAPSPALLMQRKSAKMRVNFTRMDNDGSLHNGEVDLAMVQVGEERSDASENSWTKMVSEVGGKMIESEASCNRGRFYCQGDATWCGEQEKLGCKGSHPVFLRQQGQKHLQA